jgi:hypothetical protein
LTEDTFYPVGEELQERKWLSRNREDKIARRIDNGELIETVTEIENMLKIRYDSV